MLLDKMGKTVFILGAGFSTSCGAPPQGALLKEIFNLEKKSFKSTNDRKKVIQLLDSFKSFASKNLFLSIKEIENMALEDIFTPIDRCILEDISFRDISPDKLIKIREELFNLLILALRENITNPDAEYIKHFAKILVDKCKVRTKKIKEDPISVITTNWDIILDNAIQKELDLLKESDNKEPFEGVVDYCCYVSSLNDDDRIKPGLFALGKGKFNVKLLKLHGSMNWMQCPRCQRLYVDFFQKFQGGFIFSSKYCGHCTANYQQRKHESIRLRNNLIMPTFLKDLNNFQIKLIWQNAGIELSEASKVVFIGYSLPYADFELRQLLSRMIPKNTKIEVILRNEDKPKKGFEHYSAVHRYKTFFGKNVKFNYKGASEYIMTLK